MNATQLKIGISVLAVAGTATAVVVQHQEKDRLRTDNEALVQQVAQLQTDRDNLSKQMASGASRSLTDSQLQELLQLRGEVSLLRSQTNQIARLHEENKRLLAQIQAVPVHRPAPVSEVDPAEKHAVIAVNAAKQMGLAMRMYLNDNNNQFATNFDQIQVYLGGATNFAGGISLDDFELVNVGVLDERSPQMFMLREKQPVQSADGRWIRIYGCVDGSVQRAASDNGNFDDWEKRFAAASPQGQ